MGIFDFFKKKTVEEEKYKDEIIQENENIYEEYSHSTNISIISKLIEKVNNLGEKYNDDLDMISLKALCLAEEDERNFQAIIDVIERLADKYPDDEKIQSLNPDGIEEISLEELLEYLEREYEYNTEITTIKALINLPDGEKKNKSIFTCLIRLYKEEQDENIMKYFSYLLYTEQLELDDDMLEIFLGDKYNRNPLPDDEVYKHYY